MNVDLIKEVYHIANESLNLPAPHGTHVIVDIEEIKKLAATMKEKGKVSFYKTEPQEHIHEYSKDDILFVIVRELVASSINYCYWYGSGAIRSGKASSTLMYTLVDEALQFFSPTDNQFAGHIDYLIELLSLKRFPMLEERKRHLLELVEGGKGLTFARYVHIRGDHLDDTYSANFVFEELIKNFTGFASDTFLKRASLFMIQLHRQFGWWSTFMKNLFLPADYQVPMVLNSLNCIKYSNHLEAMIMEEYEIPKNCLMEVQLRAASIVACRELCKLTDWNIADVDTWLWTKRKEFPYRKIHLTRTTDY
jgi:hypothetical protein